MVHELLLVVGVQVIQYTPVYDAFKNKYIIIILIFVVKLQINSTMCS